MPERIAIEDQRRDMLEFLTEKIEAKGYEVIPVFTEARVKKDSKLAPVLKRITELEKELKPVERPKADDLAQALANIKTLREAWPNHVKREILGTSTCPRGSRCWMAACCGPRSAGCCLRWTCRSCRRRPRACATAGGPRRPKTKTACR